MLFSTLPTGHRFHAVALTIATALAAVVSGYLCLELAAASATPARSAEPVSSRVCMPRAVAPAAGVRA